MGKTSNNFINCSTYNAIRQNKIDQNNMPFGDEGGVLACMDYEEDLRQECEFCDNYKCPYFE